jgi:hypothetical protein
MIDIRRQSVRVTLCAAGLAAVLATASIHAQIATLDERINGAERVVVATVRDVTPEWRETSHGDRLIVSRLRLEIDETLKGADAREAILEVEGGTLDGLTLRVSSLPMIRGGERAVFFMKRGNGSTYEPYLKGQGILFLDDRDVVRGSSLQLDQIRTQARGARQ